MEQKTNKNSYIVILCGGTGPRLWPLSRANHPKQFLNLLSPDSLIQQTLKRAIKIVPKENVYIISNEKYVKEIENTTKKLISQKNIIAEPLKRNTAMAILLTTAIIKAKNPQAAIATFPADHFISNLDKFSKDIKKALKIAQLNNKIVTIGIKPTNPNPAYGYILPKDKESNYFSVSQFIEKPDPELGQKLISKGALWNSGIYIFSVNTIESEFNLLQPEYFKLYNQLETCLNNPKKIQDIYLNSPELAIDKAISEKSKNMAVISANFGWSDIGEWRTILLKSKLDKNGIATIDKNTKYLSTDSTNCLVSGTANKLIGLVGVDNLAIIDTTDALLVCNLDKSFNVRDLVTLIVKSKETEKYFLSKT